jgi:antitoxin HigA-1
MRLPRNRAPTHPGEILLREFLEPTGTSQYRLANAMGVSYPRLNQIVNGKRPITIDTAFRLARYWGTSPDVWLNLQTAYDLREFEASEAFKAIREIEPMPPVDALGS